MKFVLLRLSLEIMLPIFRTEVQCFHTARLFFLDPTLASRCSFEIVSL